jgi:hypothetical protein
MCQPKAQHASPGMPRDKDLFPIEPASQIIHYPQRVLFHPRQIHTFRCLTGGQSQDRAEAA